MIYSCGVANMLFAEQVSDHARLLLPTVQMATDSRHHLDFGGWTALAQCVGLDVLIEQLVGVQLGTVARQADQSKTMRVVGHEASGDGRPVYWMTIDDQIELALGLPQQALHEVDEHRVMKLALKHHERQGPAIGDRRDHVATKALSGRAHHRRLADRGIAGSCHMVAPDTPQPASA